MDLSSSKFYWLNETMLKLYGGGGGETAKVWTGFGMTNLVL
jgi:hypothetical protein